MLPSVMPSGTALQAPQPAPPAPLIPADRRGSLPSAGATELARAVDPSWKALAPGKSGDPSRPGLIADREEQTAPSVPLDPDAPVGPPPSFEANVLDRQREEVRAMLRSESPEADASDDPDPPRYDVPPSPSERAQAGFTVIRGDHAPASSVDLSY